MSKTEHSSPAFIDAAFHVATYIKELMRNYATVIAVGILILKINDVFGYVIYAIIYFGTCLYSLEAPWRWHEGLHPAQYTPTVRVLHMLSCAVLAAILLYFPWHFVVALTTMMRPMFGH